MLKSREQAAYDSKHTHTHIYIYIYIYSSEHKDQNDVKKKSNGGTTFNFKVSENILSRTNKKKINYIIPKYKAQ